MIKPHILLNKRSSLLVVITTIAYFMLLMIGEHWEQDIFMVTCPTHRNKHPVVNYCNHEITENSQKVISFSVYGSYARNQPDFVKNVTASIALIPFFKDWRVRFYHDGSLGIRTVLYLKRKYDFVDMCDTRKVLPGIGHIHGMMKMMWRFLPIGDPSVDVFISRDIDGPITTRDSAAVAEWLNSDKLLHTMRDNPQHSIPILGGMWGYHNSLNRSLGKQLMQKAIETGKKRSHVLKYYDQTFLNRFVWSNTRESVMAHDSFHCDKYEPKSQPFPTRRGDSDPFVGCPTFRGKPCRPFVCPMKCRPKNHKDWKYC